MFARECDVSFQWKILKVDVHAPLNVAFPTSIAAFILSLLSYEFTVYK